MTEKKFHCKDCISWKESVAAGNVVEYSSGKFPVPVMVRCDYTSSPVSRTGSCPSWKPVPAVPTCYNCRYLNPDDGRAHLYGYGVCACPSRQADAWVNVETNRTSCKYHVFRKKES